jgi:S-adenosylmethionine:tRNA ribosyltransferase-isomerase
VRRALLDYDLPPDLIAARPSPEPERARLLVLDPGGSHTHATIAELPALLPAGALVVVNDTRVIPARLLGWKSESHGRVEILLVRGLGPASIEVGAQARPAQRWQALGRASKPLRRGARIDFDVAGRLSAIVERPHDEGGALEVTLFSPAGAAIDDAVDALGHVPLPPYIRRADDAADRERYQTAFARVRGAVAAPTAGLHLSSALLERIAARGVAIAAVTLHVGLGTFQPVKVDDLDDHRMHEEAFAVPPETASAIDAARARGAPVIAIGTTVVRALESAADPERPGRVRASAGETALLIQPGYAFRVVDQLFTNFHLPQSTLLALVSAFGGREVVLGAYRTAVGERYRFFSYGDAMLIRQRGEGAL